MGVKLKKTVRMVLAFVCALAVGLSVPVVWMLSGFQASPEPEVPLVPPADDMPAVLPTTGATTASPTGAVCSGPSALVERLATWGSSPEQLTAQGCRQLVVVDTAVSPVRITLFERDATGGWTQTEAIAFDGMIGYGGATVHKQ